MPYRGRKPRRSGPPARSVFKQPGISLKNNEPVTSIPIRTQVTESQVPPWSVTWFSFDEAMKNHPVLPNYTSIKVKRVGIQIPPKTYLEFICREQALTHINTRNELTTNSDCQFHYSIRPGLKTYWFKPGMAVNRSWQDVTTKVYTGLNVGVCGTNELTPGADGILFYMCLDIQLKGMNTTHAGRMLIDPLTQEIKDLDLREIPSNSLMED